MGKHKTASKVWTSGQDAASDTKTPGVPMPEGLSRATDEKVKVSWADIVRDSAALRSKAFSENVSMQGLAPICDPRSSRKRKFLWALIVVLAVTFTAYNIFTQINMYLVTPITVVVDYIRAPTLNFPTVTLCNNNYASLTVLKAYNAVQQVKDTKPLPFDLDISSPNYTGFDFTPYHKAGWENFYRAFGQRMDAMMIKVRNSVKRKVTKRLLSRVCGFFLF